MYAPLRRKALLTLAAIALLAILAACGGQQQEDGATLLPPQLRLRPGDVVLRRGSGLTSRVVLWADRGGRYSHAGIVVDSGGRPMVVHAVPGEPDFPGDVDRVKLDTPERFFSPELTDCGEVLRPADAATGRRAAQAAWHAYRRGARFDHDYDESDTTRLYCTELVLHAYRRAGCRLVSAPPHDISLLGRSWQCRFPSDLQKSPFLYSLSLF